MMMMSLNSKQAFSMPPGLHEPKYSTLPSSSTAPSGGSPSLSSSRAGAVSEAMRRSCLPAPPSNIFGGLDESLLARAEALAAVDIASQTKSQHHPHHHQHPPPPPHHHHHSPFKPDATYHTMNSIPCTSASSSVPTSHHHAHHHSHHHQPLEGEMMEHLNPGLSLGAMAGPDGSVVTTPAHPHLGVMNAMHPAALGMAHGLPAHMGCMADVDADPRDLEAFAERFKQRRIKLGVTQADVGSALANLKIPGVGSLSQSTICRFESLTLSHNNMIALKPILQAWLEEAEKAHRDKLAKPELFSGAGERKRKRTSIAAPEKRSLEAYFAIQPRPSSEKIAAIAEKLDLKKNVVRVWFCNQRQKQKRMKYSAGI
ncbi:POU domain, class 4, transcription factor 2 [Ambystoma mexicanum]|uniref:POU domain, class 4, transcription factor 2 n=1 Tax=Ambystoma mexicanum TaxID=8296 RepID=UPI0037E93AE0